VKFWVFIGAGWGIALLALTAIARLPGKNLDLYFRDIYVVFSKTSLDVAVMLVLVLPLLAATIRRLRPH
jgi:hypothetical protein